MGHKTVGVIQTPEVGATVGPIATPMMNLEGSMFHKDGGKSAQDAAQAYIPKIYFLNNLEGSMFHKDGGAQAQANALAGLKNIIGLQELPIVPGVGTPYLMNQNVVATVMGTVPY